MKEGEFFIGWQGKTPEGIGRFVRGRAWMILAVAVVLAGVVAMVQGTIGLGVFEYGKVREFRGVLIEKPVPMLIADAPDEASGESVYYLVNPFKFGFDAEAASKFHLKPVTLRGTLIYQPEDGQAMIEVVKGSVAAAEGDAGSELPREVLGVRTLRGEIIDSKCYIGVMNPGLGKAHRACAIRCISGGIPPVLLTWDREGGSANYYLLVGKDGEAINEEVLDYVALPVEVTGEVEKAGERLVLKVAGEAIRSIR